MKNMEASSDKRNAFAKMKSGEPNSHFNRIMSLESKTLAIEDSNNATSKPNKIDANGVRSTLSEGTTGKRKSGESASALTTEPGCQLAGELELLFICYLFATI